MFMFSAWNASISMGKEYSEHLRSIKNTGNNLAMEQMFDISEKLTVGQSDEIYGVTPNDWKILLGSIYLWSAMKKSPVFRTRSFTYFSDLLFCFGKMHQTAQSNTVWQDKLARFKSSSQYRTFAG